jgi:hypothetical protein
MRASIRWLAPSVNVQWMVHVSEADIFPDDYDLERDWARGAGISQRTSARHRNKPNGLPFLDWGGKIWIPRRGGAEYIQSLVKRRNPRGHRRGHSARNNETASA